MNVQEYLKGCIFGYSVWDKFSLFTSIALSLLIYLFLRIALRIIYGKDKRDNIFVKNHYTLFHWIPPRPVLIRHNEIILSINPKNEFSYFDQNYEMREITYALKLGLKDGVIVDAGANIGIYAITLARRYPDAKVIAIEASPTVFEKLKVNCKLNGVSNVILLNSAVSDQDKQTIHIYTNITTLGSSTIFADYKEQFEKRSGCEYTPEQVQTITLDTLVSEMRLDRISLLKIDIEGAELLAMQGAMQSLKSKTIKNLIVEYHSLENYRLLLSLLQSLGFECSTHKSAERDDPTGFGNFAGHIIAKLSSDS